MAAPQPSLQASARATERVPPARGASHERRAALDRTRCRLLEEAGGHVARTRLLGHAPRGERVVGTAPQPDGAHVTVMAARSGHGVEAVMPLAGATEADVISASVAQVLAPPVGLLTWWAWST